MLTRADSEVLAVWTAISRSAVDGREMYWGGREASDSLTDAHQLLCILRPATEASMFILDRPDQTRRDVARSLAALGDEIMIPIALVGYIRSYLERYTGADGRPVFSAPSHLRGKDVDDQLRSADVVPSYAASISLCLAAIGFLRVLGFSVRRADRQQEIREVESLASTRLTAAMIGLLRSFAVRALEPGTREAERLMAMLNREKGVPSRQVVSEFRTSLRQIVSRLRDDVTIGSGETTGVDRDNVLFECGWSWGIVQNAPLVDTSAEVAQPRNGLAEERPHLYHTATVVRAVADLVSERTRVLGLLSAEQLRLSQSVQLRWEIARAYWTTVATLGSGRWPIEDLPWQMVDGEESDLLSVVLAHIVTGSGLLSGSELTRLAQLLADLAGRGRVTSRATADDQAVSRHEPGELFRLYADDGIDAAWLAADYSPLLLSASIAMSARLGESSSVSGEQRREMGDLIQRVWRHLAARRITDGLHTGLWDQPAGAFGHVNRLYEGASWSFTYAVVHALVEAMQTAAETPRPSAGLQNQALEMIEEAEVLLGHAWTYANRGQTIEQEVARIARSLAEASTLADRRPATAIALATDALSLLHRLEVARTVDEQF
ncbi:hypothetical protein JIG36_28180 [Actinoplanes sp. LDG1-06]|uniref:Uncharacterized protein n=1 Tax=Paractinoplanes ovalisporus TaxID=2810368 RepID=A0ABS2AHV8_9ACTN|nr:SCO2524 family protein [Actinoplanes ovalisporus]MBM2619438.1 hypothetical protein [Actinoplanes ovalisporus]